jgi:hypothetical protein
MEALVALVAAAGVAGTAWAMVVAARDRHAHDERMTTLTASAVAGAVERVAQATSRAVLGEPVDGRTPDVPREEQLLQEWFMQEGDTTDPTDALEPDPIGGPAREDIVAGTYEAPG